MMSDEAKALYRLQNGSLPEETAYMRGGKEPVAGSVPRSTSKILNSPLFVHAFTNMSLRRLGPDVPATYDIPDMSRGLADVADYAAAAHLLEQERARNPALAAWLDARGGIDFDSDVLARCAPGTLGQAIHAFITISGMELKFVHNFNVNSDIEYLLKMLGQTHDLQHIVSGFGPNIAGEQALALMNIASTHRFLGHELARFMNMAGTFISSASYARTLFNYPEGTPILLEATKRGIEAGQAVTMPLFMLDFNAHLDTPLDQLARELGFERGEPEEWEISEELCTG
jgi:ubiquinone biosynthesis protein Coq4